MKKKTKVFISLASVVLGCLVIFINIFFLIKSDSNMNSKQGLPEIVNCRMDFDGYDVSNKYVKQHMKGEWEFFYDKWIVGEDKDAKADCIVQVPHHFKGTTINNKKLSNDGYGSYRMYVHGLKKGTIIYFINNNFVGGQYGYINKQLVFKYGTRTKYENCKSNGGDDLTVKYTVEDENDLEIVFEVSCSSQGGLFSAPRLVINTLGYEYYSPSLTNNIGFIVLGLMLSLLIFSFVVNIGIAKKNYIFIVILAILLLLTIFSIDVLWRLLSFMRTNTYNCIIEVNLFGFIALLFALYSHLCIYKKIDFNKYILGYLIISSVGIVISYFCLMGTFLQIIPLILLMFSYCLLMYPITKNVFDGNLRNIVYLILLLAILTYGTNTFCDLENIMLAGLEQSISYMMLPIIVLVVILFRLSTNDSTKRLVQALEVEKKQNQIKAESLKAQIKPHFIFNSLSLIQAAYKKDINEGENLLTMFSKHLRNNIDSAVYDEIPFNNELDHILNYVELENARKDKKINFLLDLQDTEFSLPLLSLQPYVENAFKYSKVEEKENGYILLKTYKAKKKHCILIEDNGVGFDLKNIKDTSIGLKNAKERLKLISNADVKIISKIGVGTKIFVMFNEKEPKK